MSRWGAKKEYRWVCKICSKLVSTSYKFRFGKYDRCNDCYRQMVREKPELANRYAGKTPKCKVCGNKVDRTKKKYGCWTCWLKLRKENKTVHPRWKGGKPNCRVCNKQLSHYRKNGRCAECRDKFFVQSPEMRKKNSEAQKRRVAEGKHHLWKGGVSTKNKKERWKARRSVEYKIWRDGVFRRDKYLCQHPGCDQRDRYLEGHHIETWLGAPEKRFEIDNGITLCSSHHKKTMRREEHFEKLYKEINISKYGPAA